MQITNQKIKFLVQDLDLIPEAKLEESFEEAEKENKSLAAVLVDNDLISDDHMGQVIADYLGYDFIDLDKTPIDEKALNILPEIMARKQKAVVFSVDKEGVKVAMVNPGNLDVINLIEKKTSMPVFSYYTTVDNLKYALTKYQKGIESEFSEIIKKNVNEAKGAKAQDLPIVKIVNTIIQYAYENKTSDIHIEPGDEKTRVRFRVDGIMHDVISLPKEMHGEIVTRIKILSSLRTDEHRSAQDGKIRIDMDEEKSDIRVSIVPIVRGEKIVMRLLSEKSRQFSLEDLGFANKDLVKLKSAYSKPYGMILSTGPTGSGKTTSLYAILKILNKREVNISTIEDPVEYDVERINQIQVNNKTNLTFANGLRSILRQDPDIIMVGEIRDEETASIAINAAMTGHLVLSTLHTNDAPTALPRFIDMNIEPFLVASTVNIIIAQRLVRKICSNCILSQAVELKELEQKFDKEFIKKHFGEDKDKVRLYHGKGCPVCNGTGYNGRVGVFEVLEINEGIRELIMKRADSDQIRGQAVKDGMITMIDDGIAKVTSGVTTLEEVLRVTRL